MTKLHLLAGISPPLQRLLESGGIESVEELARQDPGTLAPQISQWAKNQGITGSFSVEEVGRLIKLAQRLLKGEASRGGTAVGRVAGDLEVNLDNVPEAIAVRSPASAPAPVPAAAIPVRPSSMPAAAPARPVVDSLNDAARARAAEQVWKQVPKQKFRDFQEYAEGKTGVEPLPRKPGEDAEDVENSLKRFNYQPGEPVPRLVRRGVPHPRPYFLVFCSLIVLVSRVLMLAVIVGTPIVLWPAFVHGDKTHLITFLWVIGAWLLSCLFYLVFTLRARCRVCTNQIFWSKRCFKNQKAHRLWGLGLVGSLALHALLFGWFRCMYCGTAIRLKFVADPERSK